MVEKTAAKGRSVDFPVPASVEEAREIQEQLAKKVRRESDFGPLRTVAGVDTGFRGDLARAAVAVLAYPDLSLLEVVRAERPAPFPYVPGLLTFREGPAVLAALAKLTRMPDLFIFDGQGIAHPRRLGIASHIGALWDIPSVGCAKSRLCGRFEEPGNGRGSHTELRDRGEVIGAVLRTRTGVKPVFVSTGHRVSLADSIRVVLDCSPKYRLPETTRQADRLAALQG